jgi:hypothetical protein
LDGDHLRRLNQAKVSIATATPSSTISLKRRCPLGQITSDSQKRADSGYRAIAGRNCTIAFGDAARFAAESIDRINKPAQGKRMFRKQGVLVIEARESSGLDISTFISEM